MGDLNLEPVPENPAKKKQIAFAVAGAAVLALVLTLFSHSWLRAGGGIDAGFGLRSMNVCMGGECESQTNKKIIDEHNKNAEEMREAGFGKVETKSALFWIAGYLTGFAAVGAIVCLILSVVMVAKGQFWLKPIPPTSGAFLFLFIGLLGAVVFLVTNPTKGTGMQFGTGWAFWVFGIGTVTGIVASQLLVKFKPAEPLGY